MLKITNGKDVFEVTQGAYESIFQHQGYRPFEGDAPAVKEPEQTEETGTGTENEDEQFITGILEKPLSQWNKTEVKKFAELKGIDISGTKNAGEAKELIKAFLDEQEETGAEE